jgi:hypothetical protein
MKRRALLSAALGSSVLMPGCLGVDGAPSGEGTTVEIIPMNRTDQEISLDVAVYATDGSLLLEHTYSLDVGHADESQGVENRVDHLIVSMADGEQLRHEYDPPVETAEFCPRDGEDVQIIVEPEGITFTYSC